MNDTLSNILQLFKLNSAFYFQAAFPAPWGMEIDTGIYAQFHLVVRGSCKVFHDDLQTPILLSAGDVVVFPKGTAHWIADAPTSTRLPGIEVVQAISQNDNPFEQEAFDNQTEGSQTEGNQTKVSQAAATLICGHFELDRSLDHPLLNALPAMIHIKNNDQQEMDWIGTTSRLIIQESSRRQPGSGIILEKLAEVLLVHVFRAYLKQENHNNGFAHALIHPNVSRAIDALHNQPAYPWTLALLAKEAGLSRTAFAVLFKQLTGSTPMQYCLNWRMTLAHQFLRNSTWSIPDLAERVGYQSEAAFSRAFKRCFSITPGRVRRNSKNASHNSMVIE